jgi:CPA2 family monovalent cation:H+ antiporter-2
MVHVPQLVEDLALITAAAAVTTILFRWLKQPLVLGYIIAGIIIGPHFSLFPTIIETEGIEIWAEIGVIFLLFSLGLEFSFKKLMKVGGSASITAITEVVVMLVVGYATGTLLGWSAMDSIFLGGVLSISSTTIIIRAFDELGVKAKKFASLVFGILVIEDLVAIVLLVLLSTVAVSKQFAGTEMLFSIAKLGFFLVLWFVAGIFFLPTVLRKARPLMNDEMLLITSIALCLVMVVLATNAGFSPALGAFVMGSILAETVVGEKIEHLTTSVKDLFGAIFFVSVGMLINPAMLVNYAGPIIVIILVTIVFKTLSTTLGALISGQPLKQSVQAGMSLSQIGEFSFIIATLGLTLKVTSPFLYPIAVAVSAITTFTTPYMIKSSGSFYNWLEKVLPEKWQNSLSRYSIGAQAIKSTSDWKRVLRSNLMQMFIYSIVISSVILIMSRYVVPAFSNGKENYTINVIVAVITVLMLLPIFWALSLRQIQPERTKKLWAQRWYKGPLLMLQTVRILLTVFLILFLVNNLLSFSLAMLMLVIVAVIIIFSRKKLQAVYDRIERRFISNLNDKEDRDNEERGVHLTPWDAHIVSFIVSPNFAGIGNTLMELQLREQIGVNIAKIKRANAVINVPNRNERLFPGDVIFVIGTDDQVELLKNYLLKNTSFDTDIIIADRDVSLEQLVVKASPLAGKSIKESSIRELTKGLIVGIERNNERILNPESSEVLQEGDRLWIVGNKKRIRLLNERQINAS